MIDAAEGRHVRIVDVPGAFMQADMDELVHVRFEGKMVELLLEVDEELYRPYVTREKGKLVMYVELLKALYGTMKAARLFWEKLSAQLQEWGYTINDYDQCVATKMLNDKQCTVVWHVDNLKISHVDETVVNKLVDSLNGVFGKETPLTGSTGSVHEYLGMNLDFREAGYLGVDMIPYVRSLLEEAPKDMNGKSVTPAANHLFKMNDVDPVLLDEEKAALFHKITMQLAYLSQRARPDLRTAISFLSTRVQAPDRDDYKKLARVVRYLRNTVTLKFKLRMDNSAMALWWIDASFTVHPDMKGHTGCTMSLGSGSAYSSSSKQKLVTRSSTECELVGVYDRLPQVIWTAHFMEALGYPVKTRIYQDNTSTMLLEKNGRMSSTKRTKHIHLQYF